MNGQLSSVESFDSGSNYRFGDKMIRSGTPRSLFDLSHLNTLTIPKAGMLVPITLWETIPGDDYDINVDCLLRVMPQVVPLYSRQRLYVYGFYSRYSDLWSNWQVFMDKGYTGTDNRTIPILLNGTNIARKNAQQTIEPDSLFDYLGLPIGASDDNLFGTSGSQNSYASISALPFMMYLRIYRDYFMNKNHWIADRVMLPDDDSRFRLDDNGQLLSAVDQNKTFWFYDGNDKGFDISIDALGRYFFSGAMHDYPDDYFTSAVPWPQRGTAAVLATSGSISGTLDFTNAILQSGSGDFVPIGTLNNVLAAGDVNLTGTAAGKITTTAQTQPTASLLAALNKGTFSGSAISLGITLEQLRELALNQQMMEQLARTDGSYFQFGLSFFGEPSKAAYDYRPTYIGGTYKNIAFTEVLQTATTQTTVSGQTVTNPSGAYVGHGITGISNGRIGHIHCDDFGMIMLIACIMPDVYYSQGIDKIFTEQNQEEKYLPDRALLGFQPILNKEIYYAGNNGSSQGDDNYLWAYQNPFDHLRYMPNKIHGKIADPNSASFYPYTQARHFTQLPNWGRAFSSTNDVRQDYLTAQSEDAYSAQFSMNIRAVRPLPYKAVPAKLVHA